MRGFSFILLWLAVAVAGFAASPDIETHPVRGDYEVGVYYYPGWKSGGQWAPILSYPERQPLLGWYKEGDPRVAEWQIKWAAEHGITFFCYDWYWSKGQRQLEHALHNGFLQARNRDKMKFSLLWANHNPPGSHSKEDCVKVAQYWIQNYFGRPEYLKVAGKPVVFIFTPHRMRQDLGGSQGVREALELMRTECRRAGLPGLYLVACGNKYEAVTSGQEGFDAVSAYNWPGIGLAQGVKTAPFEELIGRYSEWWADITRTCSAPLLVPISGGWDNRPWAGMQEALVRSGRTPENFRRHLMEARRMMDARTTSVLPLAIIEAWNEFGEGSYIEPQKEFGFGYLDAVREVFTNAPREHRDTRPEDVGETVAQVLVGSPTDNRWSFEQGQSAWDAMMGLTPLQFKDGALSCRSTGNDPAFTSPPFALPAARFGAFRVRIRLRAQDAKPFKDQAQLFWSANGQRPNESTSARMAVVGDGTWHDYTIPLAANPHWNGTITHFRFDPCTRAGVNIEIQFIEMAPRQ